MWEEALEEFGEVERMDHGLGVLNISADLTIFYNID